MLTETDVVLFKVALFDRNGLVNGTARQIVYILAATIEAALREVRQAYPNMLVGYIANPGLYRRIIVSKVI